MTSTPDNAVPAILPAPHMILPMTGLGLGRTQAPDGTDLVTLVLHNGVARAELPLDRDNAEQLAEQLRAQLATMSKPNRLELATPDDVATITNGRRH